MKKGIFINVDTRTIEWVEVGDHYTDIQKVLGCDMFTTTEYNDETIIYSDDNGFDNSENFFRIKGGYYEDPIPGNGLILSDDLETGEESVDCRLSLDYVKERVEFLDNFQVTILSRFNLIGR
jgi:hypothetical protein